MRLIKIIASVLLVSTLASCDYLDIVPDNVATVDNAFTMRSEAEKYLFTVYSYIPNHADFEENPGMVTGDEVWFYTPQTVFDQQAWEIALGNQNVVDPYLNYWDGQQHGTSMFRAIRDANIFLNNIEQVKDLPNFERNRWVAEVKFLKAYYHFWLMRMYGPIPLMKENLPVSSGIDEVKLQRQPVDDVIDYIISLIDEASDELPEIIEDRETELGRISETAALAMKARILATAASPLYNGNEDYSGWTNKNGDQLISSEYDPQKWVRAAEAAKTAIDTARSVGMELYEFEQGVSNQTLSDSTKVKMSIRESVTNEWNSEVLWGDSNGLAGQIQQMATPGLFATTTNNSTRGMYAPPLRMAELYYSENGVPISEDNTWNYDERYELQTAQKEDQYYIEEGYTTANLHFDREPRFYANLGFDGSTWYGNGRLDDEDMWYLRAKNGEDVGRVELQNYSITGYFTKKIVNYRNTVTGSSYSTEPYPWPIMRLADLYLLYAETLNESEGPSAEVYRWINLVRERAGLSSVEDSWSDYSTAPNKYTTKEGLREIIHRERLIELSFEGRRIWDLKRWKEAQDKMNGPIKGWDITKENTTPYFRLKTIYNQDFGLKDYFWPIKESELSINSDLTQAPGW